MQNSIEYTLQERPETLLETRSLGSIGMINVTQEAGSFPHPATDFYYLQMGRCGGISPARITFGGDTYSVPGFRPGDLCIAPPDTDCDYEIASPLQLTVFALPATLIHSVGRDLNPSFAGDLFALHNGLFRSSMVMQRMLNMWRCASNNEATPEIHSQAQEIDLAETLVCLAMDQYCSRVQCSHLSWRARSQVLQYIDAHLCDDIPLAQLASIANLSEYHFLRAFKAEMSITPHQYIMDQRVQRTKLLLKKSNSNLADIAFKCGFSSQQHMTTVFGRAEGRTPGEFRRVTRYFVPSR
jgi:AraC family transcriptional regulator